MYSYFSLFLSVLLASKPSAFLLPSLFIILSPCSSPVSSIPCELKRMFPKFDVLPKRGVSNICIWELGPNKCIWVPITHRFERLFWSIGKCLRLPSSLKLSIFISPTYGNSKEESSYIYGKALSCFCYFYGDNLGLMTSTFMLFWLGTGSFYFWRSWGLVFFRFLEILFFLFCFSIL